MKPTRRHLAAACVALSVVLQLVSAGIDLIGRHWWLAGLQFALMAAVLLVSVLGDQYATWWDARVGKMQADRQLAALALAQWEAQVNAAQQATAIVRPWPQKWTGAN